jgi:hypothetical protein
LAGATDGQGKAGASGGATCGFHITGAKGQNLGLRCGDLQWRRGCVTWNQWAETSGPGQAKSDGHLCMLNSIFSGREAWTPTRLLIFTFDIRHEISQDTTETISRNTIGFSCRLIREAEPEDNTQMHDFVQHGCPVSPDLTETATVFTSQSRISSEELFDVPPSLLSLISSHVPEYRPKYKQKSTQNINN